MAAGRYVDLNVPEDESVETKSVEKAGTVKPKWEEILKILLRKGDALVDSLEVLSSKKIPEAKWAQWLLASLILLAKQINYSADVAAVLSANPLSIFLNKTILENLKKYQTKELQPYVKGLIQGSRPCFEDPNDYETFELMHATLADRCFVDCVIEDFRNCLENKEQEQRLSEKFNFFQMLLNAKKANFKKENLPSNPKEVNLCFLFDEYALHQFKKEFDKKEFQNYAVDFLNIYKSMLVDLHMKDSFHDQFVRDNFYVTKLDPADPNKSRSFLRTVEEIDELIVLARRLGLNPEPEAQFPYRGAGPGAGFGNRERMYQIGLPVRHARTLSPARNAFSDISVANSSRGPADKTSDSQNRKCIVM